MGRKTCMDISNEKQVKFHMRQHQMTHKGWYAIKQRNQTKPDQTKRTKQSLIYNLPQTRYVI